MTRLTAALEGDLKRIVQLEMRAAARAVTVGVREATEGLKSELRRQITSAGLGTRLANTWRGEVYPKGQPSIGAAGFVWSKAPGIVRLYAEGAVIRSKQGLFLAIPTPAAGRFGDARRKITPGAWERIHGMRLRFVYRRGSPSLLVADNVRLTKRGRATANIGRRQGAAFTRLTGRTTVPLFILVPEVTVRKRLDIDGAAQKWIAALPQLVVQHWQSAASVRVRQCAGLRCRLEGDPDPRRRSLGKVPERKTVIGVRIEKGSQPLDHRQLFLLEVRHHLGDEVAGRASKLRPAGGIHSMLEDRRGDTVQTFRQRPDRDVLLGKKRRQVAATARADRREQHRLLEGVVVDNLVEGDDELLEMLPLLRVPRIDRMLAVGADDAVLEAADQREDTEVLFVKNLPQFGQIGTGPLPSFCSNYLLHCDMVSMSPRITPPTETMVSHAIHA